MFFFILALLFFPISFFLYRFSKSSNIEPNYTCLVGKTAIVTGGNSGIGFEVCLNLASRGARVIIADKVDAEESKRRIIKITGNSSIYSEHIDLSSFESVRSFAGNINATENRLDILINNAGIPQNSEKPTENGLNRTLQVNFFGPFLLTHLLTDLLKSTTSSRVVFTSSLLAFVSNLRTAEALCASCTDFEAYCNSKLATILSADAIATKLLPFGVVCNTVHPGLVRTGIFAKTKSIPTRYFGILAKFFGKDVWQGALTTTYVATSPALNCVTGEFFRDCCVAKKPSRVNSKFAEELYDFSVKIVGLRDNEIL